MKSLPGRLWEALVLSVKLTGLAGVVVVLYMYADNNFSLLADGGIFRIMMYVFLISLPIMLVLEIFSKEE